jgi:hypothetical protein
VHADPAWTKGTEVSFRDEEWSRSLVEPQAVFTGMEVAVDGHLCARESFVGEPAAQHAELGCRIEVREAEHLNSWHRQVRRSFGYSDNVLVNFHGQTTSFDFHPVSETGLWFLVDLTAEPTGIRLMLPARTRLVENEAFEQLKAALELEAYRYIQRRGHHRLPYQQYVRAQELAIVLPEATPTFQVGLLSTRDAPDPVDVPMPKDFPLERCYRFDPDFPDGTDADETNAHLLAALGQFAEPFIPVSIRKEYDGYAWANLPTIGKVTLTAGNELHSACVWTGTLTCVSALTISVQASDGKTFSSQVCMAKAPPPADAKGWCDDEVLVTRDAQEHLSPSEIWYHFGGWCDEGDTYGTQESDFERELERFWADLLGPDEQLRRSIMEALAGLKPAWKLVKIFANGEVRVQFKDRTTKRIRPLRR